MIYRITIAAIFTVIVISSMLSASDDIGRYFIYLTNWGITLCMITTVLGAILVAVWYFHPEYSGEWGKKITRQIRISFFFFSTFHLFIKLVSVKCEKNFYVILQINYFVELILLEIF